LRLIFAAQRAALGWNAGGAFLPQIA